MADTKKVDVKKMAEEAKKATETVKVAAGKAASSVKATAEKAKKQAESAATETKKQAEVVVNDEIFTGTTIRDKECYRSSEKDSQKSYNKKAGKEKSRNDPVCGITVWRRRFQN